MAGREWGGISTYVRQLVSGLPSGHEITILSGAVASPPELRARILPLTGGRGVMATYASFQWALRRRLPDLFREYRPDVFLANHAQMPDLLFRRRPRDPPFVVIAHTTIRGQASAIRAAVRDGSPLDGSERATLLGLTGLLAAERLYWSRVSNAIFVSNPVRREVERLSTARPSTVATVLNGIDADRLVGHAKHSEAQEDGSILFASRLLGAKGLAVLLRSLPGITSQPWRLRVTGSGDLETWRRFAGSLGLPRERLEFLGNLPREEQLAVFARSSVFTLPSYSESCPYSLMEAMALGKAIAATAVPGIMDMVEDGTSALLVPPGDAAALGQALERLLADPALRRRLGAAAQARARERFTAERMCRETLKILQSIAGDT